MTSIEMCGLGEVWGDLSLLFEGVMTGAMTGAMLVATRQDRP